MTLPHEYHADLTSERIIAVTSLIAAAYEEALEYRLEEKGDTRWAHGCRRYDWARQRLRASAGATGYEYLRIVIDQANKFLFRIGDVPVKFRRTDIDDPAEGTATQSFLESQQLSMLKMLGLSDPAELSWRFLVQDNFDGEIIRIAFIGMDAATNEAKCFYEIPLEKVVLTPVLMDGFKDEGVDVPPAEIILEDLLDRDDQEATAN